MYRWQASCYIRHHHHPIIIRVSVIKNEGITSMDVHNRQSTIASIARLAHHSLLEYMYNPPSSHSLGLFTTQSFTLASPSKACPLQLATRSHQSLPQSLSHHNCCDTLVHTPAIIVMQPMPLPQWPSFAPPIAKLLGRLSTVMGCVHVHGVIKQSSVNPVVIMPNK